MHTMPTVAYTTIVGASGYAGQETLDRVLAHPELELYAIGSHSLPRNGARAPAPPPNGARPLRARPRLARRQGRRGARPAPEPQRRQARPEVHHERGRTRERWRPRLPLPLARAGRGDRAPEEGRRDRPLRRTPLRRPRPLRAVVRLRPPAARRARRGGLRPARAASTPRG